MATVKAFIRTTTKNKDLVNVRFRLTDGRSVQLFYKSELMVEPDKWDEKREAIKNKILYDSLKRFTFDKAVVDLKQILLDVYNTSDKSTLTSEKFVELIDQRIHPEKYEKPKDGFFDLMEEYLEKRKLSEVREKNFRVLLRALKRYECWVKVERDKSFKLEVDSITKDTIKDFEIFLKNEYLLFEKYPSLYEQFPAIIGTKRKLPKPEPRGNNTICALFNKLRAFFNWCNEQGKSQNAPFTSYDGITTEKYGTPYYITIDERNMIAEFDFSDKPHLAVQRDIFVFHCLIGCRASDLMKLTKNNIIEGSIEYIPHKTKDERPLIVRVPLNDRAKKLIKEYAGKDKKGRLFPFISKQKYNDAIKDIFKKCGIIRNVTILNPTTGEEEKRRICDIASSHLARRTFIGNLYKKVKDPNLIGSMSGHAEGSKAFARYRDIDDDIKKELVDMLE